MWATARAHESVVLLMIESKNHEKIKYHLDQASFYFISSENASNSVALYSKASKYFEDQKLIDQAIEAEQKALDILIEFEVKTRKSETINHLVSLLVEAGKYAEAIDVYKKGIEGDQSSIIDSVLKFE